MPPPPRSCGPTDTRGRSPWWERSRRSTGPTSPRTTWRGRHLRSGCRSDPLDSTPTPRSTSSLGSEWKGSTVRQAKSGWTTGRCCPTALSSSPPGPSPAGSRSPAPTSLTSTIYGPSTRPERSSPPWTRRRGRLSSAPGSSGWRWPLRSAIGTSTSPWWRRRRSLSPIWSVTPLVGLSPTCTESGV